MLWLALSSYADANRQIFEGDQLDDRYEPMTTLRLAGLSAIPLLSGMADPLKAALQQPPGPARTLAALMASGNVPAQISSLSVDSMAALRATLPQTASPIVITLRAFYSGLDGGGGAFVWKSTAPVSSEDGGTAIAPTGATLGCWLRLDALLVRVWNALWFGASPAMPRSVNTAALNTMFTSLGRLYTATPDGTYLGGGVAYIPQGYFKCTGVVNATPIVSPNVNISAHVSIIGDGQLASSLDFDTGGVLATDYPGGNLSTQVHVRDLGLYNTSSSNTHAGLAYQGAADCVIERCRIAGFATAIDTLDCNTMTFRDIIFAAAAGGVPAIAGSIGVALRGSANQMRVRDCQFNGPGINVLHGGGAGNVVSDCNSEGGVLGWFTGVVSCEHKGWTTEGQDATNTARLFYFDDQGAIANVDVADGVNWIRCFLGGSATRDIVRLAPHATINNIGWEQMTIANQPPGGVFQGCQSPSHIGGTCYSIGKKIAPAPNTGPLFDHTPAQYKDLTA